MRSKALKAAQKKYRQENKRISFVIPGNIRLPKNRSYREIFEAGLSRKIARSKKIKKSELAEIWLEVKAIGDILRKASQKIPVKMSLSPGWKAYREKVDNIYRKIGGLESMLKSR